MLHKKIVLFIFVGIMRMPLFAMEENAAIQKKQDCPLKQTSAMIDDADIPLLLVHLKYSQVREKTTSESTVYDQKCLNAHKKKQIIKGKAFQRRKMKKKNSPLDLRDMQTRYKLKKIVNFGCPFNGCEHRAFTNAKSLGAHLSKLHRDAFLPYDVSYLAFVAYFTKN